MQESEKWKWSHSVVSDSVWPHRLQPSRLLCPWDFPGKCTGVGCHCLLGDDIAAWLQTSSLSYFLIGAQPFQSGSQPCVQHSVWPPTGPQQETHYICPWFFFFFFWLHTLACGTLVLWQGSNPHPLHCRQSLNHWTTRKVPVLVLNVHLSVLCPHPLLIYFLQLRSTLSVFSWNPTGFSRSNSYTTSLLSSLVILRRSPFPFSRSMLLPHANTMFLFRGVFLLRTYWSLSLSLSGTLQSRGSITFHWMNDCVVKPEKDNERRMLETQVKTYLQPR